MKEATGSALQRKSRSWGEATPTERRTALQLPSVLVPTMRLAGQDWAPQRETAHVLKTALLVLGP